MRYMILISSSDINASLLLVVLLLQNLVLKDALVVLWMWRLCEINFCHTLWLDNLFILQAIFGCGCYFFRNFNGLLYLHFDLGRLNYFVLTNG